MLRSPELRRWGSRIVTIHGHYISRSKTRHLYRLQILRNPHKVKNSANFKEIAIAPDRTQAQRDSRRAMVQEMKVRAATGEQNLVIHNNRITILGPFETMQRLEPISPFGNSNQPSNPVNGVNSSNISTTARTLFTKIQFYLCTPMQILC